MIKYKPSVAHIVYASDDRFAEILGVSLVSLYENSKDMENIIVYILDSGITDWNKKKLVSVCKSYNRSDVIFIPGKNISEKLSMNVAVDRGSLSQYARLFVSSDLPQELSRVLYLDCDTVVKSLLENCGIWICTVIQSVLLWMRSVNIIGSTLTWIQTILCSTLG